MFWFCAAALMYIVLRAFRPARVHRPLYQGFDARDYKTPEWQNLRAYIIKREHGKCQYCHGRAETAHHISYREGVICDPRYLEAVCWKCHRAIHYGDAERS